MSTSKLQREVSMALSTHLGGYIIRENTRPEWLTDDTGARLELDFFIEELSVAIEVQGAQHYTFTSRFHRDRAAFAIAMQRDRFKHRACLVRGVKLYEIASASDVLDVIEDIQLNIAPVSFIPTDMQPVRDAGKARMKANNQREHNAAVARKKAARDLKKIKRKIASGLRIENKVQVAFHEKKLAEFYKRHGQD